MLSCSLSLNVTLTNIKSSLCISLRNFHWKLILSCQPEKTKLCLVYLWLIPPLNVLYIYCIYKKTCQTSVRGFCFSPAQQTEITLPLVLV